MILDSGLLFGSPFIMITNGDGTFHVVVWSRGQCMDRLLGKTNERLWLQVSKRTSKGFLYCVSYLLRIAVHGVVKRMAVTSFGIL